MSLSIVINSHNDQRWILDFAEFGEFCIEDEHFPLDFEGFLIKFTEISDFVTIFNSLVLRAPMELDKKLGHYEYLLLEKRSFPGSFVL